MRVSVTSATNMSGRMVNITSTHYMSVSVTSASAMSRKMVNMRSTYYECFCDKCIYYEWKDGEYSVLASTMSVIKLSPAKW